MPAAGAPAAAELLLVLVLVEGRVLVELPEEELRVLELELPEERVELEDEPPLVVLLVPLLLVPEPLPEEEVVVLRGVVLPAVTGGFSGSAVSAFAASPSAGGAVSCGMGSILWPSSASFTSTAGRSGIELWL